MTDLDSGNDTGRRPRWPWIVGGVAALVVIGVVAFGYFGVHTLFVDDEVDEALPVFASGASADQSSTTSTADPVTTTAPAESATTTSTTASSTTTQPEPEIVTAATGTFAGVGRYSGTGTAVILTDGTQRFVRFEDDFSTTNGPDLFVYLGTGSGAYGDPAQYVELGVLSGNVGSQNYEIPAVHPTTGEPIDLDLFTHVAVWCKRFDSTFAVAELG